MANPRRQSMRGHAKKLEMPRCRTNHFREMFPNRIIDLWNNLPAELINVRSLNSFKQGIRRLDI